MTLLRALAPILAIALSFAGDAAIAAEPLSPTDAECGSTLDICEKFVRAAVPDQANALAFTLLSIQEQEETYKGQISWSYNRYLIVQWMLIVIGFMSAVTIALGTKYPLIAPWAIVPAALVTAISGINGLYNFRDSSLRDIATKAALSQLETEILERVLFTTVNPPIPISTAEIDGWNKRRDEILSANLQTYLNASKPKVDSETSGRPGSAEGSNGQ